MSVWTAVAWGAFSSASLFAGQALARPMGHARRLTGMVMGFGAGTLLSAVAYELVPESTLRDGWLIGVWCLVGALTYYVGDWLVDQRGGADRQAIASLAPRAGTDVGTDNGAADARSQIETERGADDGSEDGSGAAMFLGALLDGLPEAFILGISLALGGSVSRAFVVAVFVSNIPQGIAGTTSLQAAGYTNRHILAMWAALTAGSGIVAGVGFAVADSVPDNGLHASAFAAGAVLVMLADSMMPEAFEHGGPRVGLLTVLGYLVAAALSVAQ